MKITDNSQINNVKLEQEQNSITNAEVANVQPHLHKTPCCVQPFVGTKYFQMEGLIDELQLTKFMEFCNIYLPDNACTVVINSGGGKSTLAEMIVEIINSHSENFTLVSAGCYSAAFSIFKFVKCQKKIIKGSLGMYHKEYLRDVFINKDNKPTNYSDLCQIENFNCIDESWFEAMLNRKEKAIYRRGEDVYFTFKRMVELFPEASVVG